MTHPITITARLALEPDAAETATQVSARIAHALADAEDLALTTSFESGARVLHLCVGAASQAAVDRHLKEHGPLYAGFDGFSRLTGVTVSGPVDEETIAALRRLGGSLEIA